MVKTPTKFKIKDKVFYPAHGAGVVKSIKNIDFAGETKRYYEFDFINTELTISTPVENVDRLGVRDINKAKNIEEALKVLKKKPIANQPTVTYNELMSIMKTKDLSGDINSFIEIIQFCNQEKNIRSQEGRLIPSSIVKHFKNAVAYLVGELSLSKNISYEKGLEEFEKLTGLSVD